MQSMTEINYFNIQKCKRSNRYKKGEYDEI